MAFCIAKLTSLDELHGPQYDQRLPGLNTKKTSDLVSAPLSKSQTMEERGMYSGGGGGA